MWNLLVGALAVGSAIVLFDGDPNAPDEQTLWQVVAETGATAFACGSTLIVTHRATGYVPRARFDLTKLRSVFCTGSPLPADGFRWIYEAVSETVYLQSSSGGTDVCGAFVGGSPMLPVRRQSAHRRAR
jgi:acetoacetyl-CoA synthetase